MDNSGLRLNLGRIAYLAAIAGLSVAFSFFVSFSSCDDVSLVAPLINFLMFFAWFLPALLFHEAAHAVAALAVGLQVFRITLGMGPILWQGRLGSLDVEFRRVPIYGRAYIGAAEGTQVGRLQAAAVYFSGPALHIVIVLVLAVVVPGGASTLLGEWNCGPIPLGALFLANLVLTLNLIPFRTWKGFLGYSDGYRLMRLIRDPEPELSGLRSARFLLAIQDHVNSGQIDEAHAVAGEGLEKLPGNFWLALTQAELAIGQEEFTSARESLLGLLRLEENDAPRKALLWNLLAYATVLSGQRELLEEAERFTNQATKIARIPSFVGTQGAFLIRQGMSEAGAGNLAGKAREKVVKGIELLEWAFRKGETPRTRAADAGWIALGHAYLGLDATAQKWIDKGGALCPNLLELRLAEEAMVSDDRALPADDLHL